MSVINFILKLVITVLFIASALIMTKWRKLSKALDENRFFLRLGFGLLILGIYFLLDSFQSLMELSSMINPLNKIIELTGLIIIMFGFLDFVGVSKSR